MGDAALDLWLGHLLELLRSLSPRGLAVVRGVPMDRDAARLEALPPQVQWLASTPGFDVTQGQAWLLRLYVRDQAAHSLLVVLERELDEAEPLLMLGF